MTVPAGLLVGLAAALLELLAILEPIELVVYDRLFEWRGPRAPQTPIVIVAIDEASFVELQEQWPFPRAMHAEVIGRIAEGGALAIGVDIFFDLPSRRGPGDDEALGDAIRLAGNVVLAAAPRVEPSDVGPVTVRREFTNIPVPTIRSGAAGIGATTAVAEQDAVMRRFPTRVAIGGKEEPSFDIAVYRVATKVGLTAKALPTTSEVRVNFRGGPRTFKWVPYYQVLRGEVRPESFKGKVVLIGATTSILHDVFPTPFALSGDMPDVEVHANALETLVRGDRIRDTGSVLAALFSLGSALFVAVSVARYPVRAAAYATVLLLATWALVYAAFAFVDIWLRVAGPSLAITLSLLAAIVAASRRLPVKLSPR